MNIFKRLLAKKKNLLEYEGSTSRVWAVKDGTPLIYEFQFSVTDMTPAMQEDVIKFLYEKILHRDNWWHFFYEGAYVIIRCSFPFAPFVKRKLRRLDIIPTVVKPWVDDNKTVNKYRRHFAKLFHEYSVLIMHMETTDPFAVIERASHGLILNTFYVHQQIITRNEELKDKPLLFEANVLDALASGRRRYVEWYYQQLAEQKARYESLHADRKDV